MAGATASPARRACALNDAGFLARYQADYAAAQSLIAGSLVLSRELADRRGIADALSNLGYVTLYQGNYTTARALYEESLVINRELGNEQGIADTLHHLGLVAFYEGDYDTARLLREECVSIWRRLGDRHGVADALFNLGQVALRLDEPDRARARFAESLATARELGSSWAIAQALEGFAALAAVEGQPERALRLAGAATLLRESSGTLHSPAAQAEFDSRLEPARRALTADAATAAWAGGQTVPLEAVIAEVSNSSVGHAPNREPLRPARRDAPRLADRLKNQVMTLTASPGSSMPYPAASPDDSRQAPTRRYGSSSPPPQGGADAQRPGGWGVGAKPPVKNPG